MTKKRPFYINAYTNATNGIRWTQYSTNDERLTAMAFNIKLNVVIIFPSGNTPFGNNSNINDNLWH